MGRYRTAMSEEKVRRWIAEGRGQGEGAAYKPWITVRDFPSMGRVHRVQGWKTGRVHHLMSDQELYYFYTLEWMDDIEDIREQYPLPLSETVEIAERLGVRHPADRGCLVPMTDDFLITVRTPIGPKEVVRTIKPINKLTKRVLQKFAIARRYWNELGVEWAIVTDLDIPLVLAKNVERVHSSRRLDSLPLEPSALLPISDRLLSIMQQSPGEPLRKVSASCDTGLGLRLGSSLSLVWHWIATKQWVVDMATVLDPDQPLKVEHVSLTRHNSQQAKTFE